MTRVPTAYQHSYKGVLIGAFILVCCVFVGWQFSRSQGPGYGMIAYLVLRISLRQFPRSQRLGFKLIQEQKFSDAISTFGRSLEFFDRHPWLDRFRYVFFLSLSAISYREMAMLNIAYCYSQMGDGKKARLSYQACLERFPESYVAQSAINMLDSGRGT